MAGGWRYLAQRLNGDGTGTFLHMELPLSGVSVTDALSGPNALNGSIPVEYSALLGTDGRPLLEPWSTAIYAEADGEIRGGGLLVSRASGGPNLDLECIGFAGYAKGMPYTDSYFGVEVDPIDMLRKIWSHLQSQPQGNLGLQIDSTLSGLKIGTVLTEDQFDTQNGPIAFESGPYKLAWYQTDDLGKEMDDLASSTPFDYYERHYWNADRSDIEHRLHIGYPRLGRRRTDLTFNFGENIAAAPTITVAGEDYANGIMVLGAGEGRDMVRSDVVTVPDGRLRRIGIVTDKSLKTKARAVARARSELAMRNVLAGDVTDIDVRDHPNARIGSWVVGDEVFVRADTGWEDVAVWCRIVESTLQPESANVASLSIIRSDKVAA